MGGSTPYTLHVETSAGFDDTMRRMGRFDKVLISELRTSTRAGGKAAVVAVRDRVRSGTYVTNVGTRVGIAQGVRLEDMPPTAHAAGVRIIASPDALPDDRKLMIAAWQKTSFKHPVFGDKGVVVDQSGRPYFYQTIDTQQPRMTSEVQRGAQRAANTLSGGPA